MSDRSRWTEGWFEHEMGGVLDWRVGGCPTVDRWHAEVDAASGDGDGEVGEGVSGRQKTGVKHH